MKRTTNEEERILATIYSITESAHFWERLGYTTAAARAWQLVEKQRQRLKELQK